MSSSPMHAAALASMDAAPPTKDVAPFLKQLRKMLDDESAEILRWTPTGRAFEIVDMERMMDVVLPKYFKHRKYTSFQRQLNYFNFRKWTKSKATVCTFSNEYFVRDQPELAWRITRKKSLHVVSASHKRSFTSGATAAALCKASSSSRPAQAIKDEPTAAPLWSKDTLAGISVPTTSYHDVHAHASFPSPTDMEMMLKVHDYLPYELLHSEPSAATASTAFRAQQQHASSASGVCEPAISMDPLESLDWIDALLPHVDRIEDDVYPFTYPSMSSLLLTSAPPRAYDFAPTAML